jgi:hypothetical protein
MHYNSVCLMASPGTIFGVIALIIVILVGGAVALLYLYPSLTHKTTTTPTTTTPSTSTSSATSTSSTSSSSTTCTSSCALQLLQSGSGPVLNSPMTTPMSKTSFMGDGPCCSSPPAYQDEINYTDNGNLWTLQGDLNPSDCTPIAATTGCWAMANSSGLTLEYQTCPNKGNLTLCGPWHENWQDHEGSMDSSMYGDLGAVPVCSKGCDPRGRGGTFFGPSDASFTNQPLSSVPSDALVFSIEVSLPYHSYYPSCTENTVPIPAGAGCTYEFVPGTMPLTTPSPYDSATLGFDVGGNYDIVSVAEVCPCTSSSNSLEMSAYTSNGGSSINLPTLNTTTIPNFTPTHKLTIVTDRKTFIAIYVDNNLLYYSTTLPIQQNPIDGSGVMEFSTRTNINNETDIVTYSNATVYSTSTITATGLSPGMTLVVHGPNGFVATGTANSTGIAAVEVAAEPENLTVSVQLNGNTVATYSGTVSAGAVFKLAS